MSARGAHLANRHKHWLLTLATLLVLNVATAQLLLAALPPSALKQKFTQAIVDVGIVLGSVPVKGLHASNTHAGSECGSSARICLKTVVIV
jgi:hypothetical protein